MDTSTAIQKMKYLLQSQDINFSSVSNVLEECLADAVERYNDDKPIKQVIVVTGNDAKTLALPSNYVRDFTVIDTIEYPVSKTPPEFIDARYWRMHQTPEGASDEIVFLDESPSSSQSVHLHMTIRVTSVSDVRTQDERSLISLACYYACEAEAQKDANTTDDGRGLDFTNHIGSAGQRNTNSKRFMDYYEKHIFGGDEKVKPGISHGNWDTWFGKRNERITHDRRYH